MNLIPIVYTSLLIFVAITFFIIAISFIIYKIRNKNEIYVKKHELRPIVKKTYQQNNKQLQKPAHQENFYNRKENVSAPVYRQQDLKTQIHTNQPGQRIEMLRTTRPRETYENKQYARPVNSKVRTTNPEDRFKILNNFQNNQKDDYLDRYSGSRNILNYYENDDLVCFPPVYNK